MSLWKIWVFCVTRNVKKEKKNAFKKANGTNSALKLLYTSSYGKKKITDLPCLEKSGNKTKLWVLWYSLLKRTTAKHCLEQQSEDQKGDRNSVREELVLKNLKLFRHMNFLWTGHCIILTWIPTLNHSVKPGKTNFEETRIQLLPANEFMLKL